MAALRQGLDPLGNPSLPMKAIRQTTQCNSPSVEAAGRTSSAWLLRTCPPHTLLLSSRTKSHLQLLRSPSPLPDFNSTTRINSNSSLVRAASPRTGQGAITRAALLVDLGKRMDKQPGKITTVASTAAA